jgi:hypothetical protein
VPRPCGADVEADRLDVGEARRAPRSSPGVESPSTAVQQQGKSGAALVEAVLPTLKKDYGQWNFFAFLAEPNIRDMEAELSGRKRVPQP